MLFNSFEFILFLPLVFCIYWFVVNRNLKIQNLFVVVASYFFYGWWDWRFLILIAITSFFSWLSGVLMGRLRKAESGETDDIQRKCKWITGINIFLNLGILGYFKYYNFFVDSFIEAFRWTGFTFHPSTLQIILPVGISFYTFQALSYSIDVFRKRLEPTKDIIAFFAFVSFFPQLVAGPIERATNLLVQFYKPRTVRFQDLADGMRQVLWGFFKKMVIADNCAIVVDDVFGNYANYPASTLLLGAVMFAFQIYGDFSGYSDIAIGTARFFGFTLKKNFDFPYFSRNVMEFWKRWHISLNTWFVDYVYIPLGGNREGKFKYVRNVLVIFLLSGLWHGANWTFIVWGLYHAVLFIPFILLDKKLKSTRLSLRQFIPMCITFLLVTIGWIIFRAETLTMALEYATSLFTSSLFGIPKVDGVNNITAIISLFFIAVLLVTEWINRDKSFGLDLSGVRHTTLRFFIYAFLFVCIYFFGADSSAFIYFQF